MLFLLPNLLGPERDAAQFLPAGVFEAVAKIDGLIAESEKGGRGFLKRFRTKKKPHEVPLAHLNTHTPARDFDFLLEPALKGEIWGIVSDAGLPCLADPGAALILRARQLGISIKAFSGPSSVTMALMLSGLSGQHFTFRGYIAKDAKKRSVELKKWEKCSREERSTQIFIEAPYRNEATLMACLETLEQRTLLCVATDLTLPSEEVHLFPIGTWKKRPLPEIRKRPTIFLFESRS